MKKFNIEKYQSNNFSEEFIELLKEGLPSFVQSITPADRKAGHNMYVCPLCGSGSHGGRSSDGAFSITSDGKSWKCFSCGEGGDIFDLIRLHEGLTNFPDQVKRAAEVSGISLQQETKKPASDEPAVKTDVPHGRYWDYIERCRAAASKTDYFAKRGFDNATVQRFHLGFDESANMIVIPYNVNGTYYLTRSIEGKSFRKPKSEDAGSEPIYQQASLYKDKPCFVCESPIDAISIMAAGKGSAEAVALGGTGYLKLIEQLKKKKPACGLILSFDEDQAGKDATEKTAAALSDLKVPFIIANYSLDQYPEGMRKDVNDFLRGNPEQLNADILANIEEIKNAKKKARHIKFFDGIEEESVSWLIPGRIPKGEVVIMGADGGSGKSTVICDLAAGISSGRTTLLDADDNLPDAWKEREPGKVFIFSSEDDAAKVIKSRLRKHDANMSNVGTMFIDDDDFNELTFTSDLLAEIIEEERPTLVIFDPLQSFVPPEVNMAARNEMRHCVKSLIQLAHKFGTTFLVIMHCNKRKGAYGRQRLADSSDMWDAARSVMMLGCADRTGTKYVSHEKSNYSKTSPTLLFRITDEGKIKFAGTTTKTDYDFVKESEQMTRQAPTREEIMDFIINKLIGSKDHTILTKDLDTEAIAKGYTPSSLRRAKETLRDAGKIHYKFDGLKNWYTALSEQ